MLTEAAVDLAPTAAKAYYDIGEMLMPDTDADCDALVDRITEVKQQLW